MKVFECKIVFTLFYIHLSIFSIQSMVFEFWYVDGRALLTVLSRSGHELLQKDECVVKIQFNKIPVFILETTVTVYKTFK